MSVAIDVAAKTLRCASCSHAVGTSTLTVTIVGLFKASAFPMIPQSHQQEVRKRCRSCGWVNVFHPLALRRAIVVK